MRKPSPECVFCYDPNKANYVAAQSADQGKTIKWLFVCQRHVVNWVEDSDWPAPVYKLAYT